MTYPKNCSKLEAAQSTPTFRTWTWGRDSLSLSSSSSCFLTNISFMFVVALVVACKWNFCQFSPFAWDREGGGIRGSWDTTNDIESYEWALQFELAQPANPFASLRNENLLLFFFFLCEGDQWNGTIKFNRLSIVNATQKGKQIK